jgi:DNA-binding HxlR family transcriptional regulator
MMRKKSFGCPTELALSVLGSKWRVVILAYLKEGVHRFGELKRRLPAISGKVLTQQLRALAREGLIERTIYSEVPARTEYELTEYGRTLIPVLEGIYAWGVQHARRRVDERFELAVAPQQVTALAVSLKAGRQAASPHGAYRRASGHR